MDGVKTLTERAHDFRMRLDAALVEIDAALGDYARHEGGRFIRYGSTTTGRATFRSDIDIIADFSDESAAAACRFAENLCLDLKFLPDVRPSYLCSDAFVARAAIEGINLP